MIKYIMLIKENAVWKPIWRVIKSNIKVFVSVFVITLLFKIYGTIRDTFNEEWQDMGSSYYNIQTEYQLIGAFTVFRTFLLKHGVSNENLINSFLKSKQEYYYQDIKNKVGDDLILDFLWIKIEYLPYFIKNISAPTLEQILIDNIGNYFTKPSKIKKVDRFLRYSEIDYLIGYLIGSKEIRNKKLCNTLLSNITPGNSVITSTDRSQLQYIVKSMYVKTLLYCLYTDSTLPNFELCRNDYFRLLNGELQSFNITKLPPTKNKSDLMAFQTKKQNLLNTRQEILNIQAECNKTKVLYSIKQ